MGRPYKRVEYQSSNGFEYPYWDIKTPASATPTPSVTVTPTPSVTVTPTATPVTPTPTPTPSTTPLPSLADRTYEFTIDTTKINNNSSGTDVFNFSNTQCSFLVPCLSTTTINWGDGNSNTVDVTRSHTYSSPGIYTISVVTPGYFKDCSGMEFRLTESVGFEGDAVKVIGASKLAGDNYTLSRVLDDFAACRNFTGFTGDALNVKLQGGQGGIFRRCNSLVSGLSNWDMSLVTNLLVTFEECSVYNEDLSGWDVSSVTDMGALFYDTAFNQDIGGWDIGSVVNPGMTNIFGLSNLQTINYNQILIGWASQAPNINNSINLFGVPCGYQSSAQSARNVLTGTYGWNINDGGLVP